MENFETIYQRLNQAQRTAVDAIDGPVLVIAGPGTGKTQLLSARVAQILRQTDTLPQNILCLTFTESGAANMRERLTRFIGKGAYDVAIGTYHAFGGDLIRRYPEYFIDTRLERPVDELGKRQILTAIIDNLSYRSPLKQTRHHLGDLMTTISEVKRGLLSPVSLRAISAANLSIIETASAVISETLSAHVRRLPSKLAVSEQLFGTIYATLEELAEKGTSHIPFENLAELAKTELAAALNEAANTNKTTPLTKWKNSWLIKNSQNQFILGGALEAARINELACVLESYEETLADQGLYDFDDMILRAIQVLEQNDELKYTLQEQYQYVLLDEFQDTNAAQLRLVELLTDNPANEGRPNVLAVGDDDQAIYAFQGAKYSNMLDFMHLFRDVLVVNLIENYRSSPEILETARTISDQITNSLQSTENTINKTLQAAASNLPLSVLVRTDYASEVAERAGIASTITSLISSGVKPSDIAILAPKHKYLEPVVPYLRDHKIPVRYERRENILEAPIIRQILAMSKLIIALHDRQLSLADSLWPEVLSYNFWGFPVSDIWKLSWESNQVRKPWTELLLANTTFRSATLLFLTLASQIETETCETILDRVIGTEEVQTNEADIPSARSPLRSYLLDSGKTDVELYQTVTELTVLRARFSEHQVHRGTTLFLKDLIDFIAEYEAANEQMVNTSPYSEASDAVQLMTVFKAKGLEFGHVFLINCSDDVWGSSSRGNSNKLTLPANLAPIRHAGSTEDERLRIFFVAVTRAKYGLHLSRHTATYSGKTPPRLKYLGETVQPDSTTILASSLPKQYQTVVADTSTAVSLETLELNWRNRHTSLTTTMKELLQDQLARYRLSPTHLTKFIDLEHAGPESFLLQNLLKFPSAQSVDLAFGNCMHETLEWLQQQVNEHGSLPHLPSIVSFFQARLAQEPLTVLQLSLQQTRGASALEAYLQSGAVFSPGNHPEHNFRNEGVVLGDGVLLSGKIDLLEIDQEAKAITIVDYKTGSLGSNKTKLHKYELQLYCYKILVEGSHTYRNYMVNSGSLIFVEPDGEGKTLRHNVIFSDAETERTRRLILAMWKHIQDLDIPDVSQYGTSLKDIRQFEDDLIA